MWRVTASLGSVLIADEVKEHSKQAIAALKAQGVRTIMLTGDSEAVASEISGQLGLDEYHAQLLPADKVNRVEELLATKGKNDILTFAGDGHQRRPRVDARRCRHRDGRHGK